MSGYSGTPLVKKLGIKEGFQVRIINAPAHYRDLLGELPNDVMITEKGKSLNINYLFI